jgi:hypothetical protein
MGSKIRWAVPLFVERPQNDDVFGVVHARKLMTISEKATGSVTLPLSEQRPETKVRWGVL